MVYTKLQSNKPQSRIASLCDVSLILRFSEGFARAMIVISVFTVFLHAPLLLRAQTAEDYFHGGATNYVFGAKEKAKEQIVTGLQIFPSDPKLNQMLALLKKEEQQKQQQQQQQQSKNDQNKDQKQNQDSQKKDSDQKKD